jgi:hypothetical protein
MSVEVEYGSCSREPCGQRFEERREGEALLQDPDQSADERCTRPMLDFLRTTEVARRTVTDEHAGSELDRAPEAAYSEDSEGEE